MPVRDDGLRYHSHIMIRRHLLLLTAWTAVCALFFGPLLLQLARLPNGDFAAQFHSFALFQSSEMAAGRLPLWSPGSYGGFPFAADTQSAVFYPLRWLTVLLSLPWGLSYYALELEAIAHVWLAGAFTYGLATDQTRKRWAGLLAALAFGLGGYLVSYPIQQLAILETIAWLPLVLLLLRRAFRPGARPVAWLMAAACVLGLSLLAGHPQTFLQISYLTAAYYLFLAGQARWRWTWTLRLGTLFLAVVIGVSTVAWLPALRYAAETTRTTADYAFVATGLPLLDYLQTVVPGALTVWSPQYVGLAAVFFAAVAWAGRRAAGDSARAELTFWSLAALFAGWLSLGDKGILFQLAYRVAPGLSLFRQQERWAGIFSFSLALVAAQGLAIWLRPAGITDRRLRRAAAGVVLALAVVGLMLGTARNLAVPGWPVIWIRQGIILAALIGVAVLPFLMLRRDPKYRRRHSWLSSALPATLLLLLTLDLFLATRPTMYLVDEPPTAIWPQPAWMTALQRDHPGRIDSQNLFVANVGEAYGLEDIRGISPLKSRAVERYEQLPRPLRWRLLNVTHVIAPEAIEPGLSPLAPVTESILPGETAEATLFRVDNPLPRAWAVDEVLTANSDETALAMLTQPGFNPARQAILTGDLPAGLPPQSDNWPPRITTTRTPQGLDIDIDVEAPSLVVISEWWRDGWRVTLDGQTRLPLLRANAGLSAVVVPTGQHSLSLRFQPLDIWVGLAVTLLTLLAAIACGLLWQPDILLRPAGNRVGTPAQVPSLPTATSATTLWRLSLIALVLLGFGLRVLMLGNQELRGDEAFSYLFTRLPLDEVIPELIDQGDPHPPLHYLALNVWAGLAGVSELALRYLSALAGTLLLPVLAVLGRRMGGARAGILTAGLAAIAPGLIWLSQDVRNQYTLVMLFAALATLMLVTRPSASRERRVAYWLLYSVFAALTVYHHYYGVFALLSHGLYLWLTPGRKRDLPAWMISGTAVVLALLPWLMASSASLLGAGQLSDPSQPELARHLVATGMELIVGPSLPWAYGRWLFLGGLAVAGAGALDLLRRRTTAGWGAMLLGWLALAFLGTYLVRFSRGTFNPFYISVAAPAWWLLVSAGIVALWRRSLGQGRAWQRAAAVIAPVVLLIAILIGLNNLFTNPTYSRTLGYRAVAEHLSAEAGPNDVFIDHFPDPVWDYYLRDVDIARSLQPAKWGTPAAETEAALAVLAATHDRLWFVPYAGSVWDPDNVTGRWLDYHLLAEERADYDRHHLDTYRSAGRASSILFPVSQRAGDIELQAAYITVDGRPGDLSAPIVLPDSAVVEITLLWKATATPATNYTAFVHILDASGALVAQHDGIPKDGTRPTTTWQLGETLLDRHTLTIPQGVAGNGRLVVGLYDSETVERLRFRNGTDSIPLAKLSFDLPTQP